MQIVMNGTWFVITMLILLPSCDNLQLECLKLSCANKKIRRHALIVLKILRLYIEERGPAELFCGLWDSERPHYCVLNMIKVQSPIFYVI